MSALPSICPTCKRPMRERKRSGETPSRLAIMKPFMVQVEDMLKAALTEEQAVEQGYHRSSKWGSFALRIWNNRKRAFEALHEEPEGTAALVWQRDRKDVQVWVRAAAKSDAEEMAITKKAIEDADQVMEEFLKENP